jgi:hypothetical protein
MGILGGFKLFLYTAFFSVEGVQFPLKLFNLYLGLLLPGFGLF